MLSAPGLEPAALKAVESFGPPWCFRGSGETPALWILCGEVACFWPRQSSKHPPELRCRLGPELCGLRPCAVCHGFLHRRCLKCVGYVTWHRGAEVFLHLGVRLYPVGAGSGLEKSYTMHHRFEKLILFSVRHLRGPNLARFSVLLPILIILRQHVSVSTPLGDWGITIQVNSVLIPKIRNSQHNPLCPNFGCVVLVQIGPTSPDPAPTGTT